MPINKVLQIKRPLFFNGDSKPRFRSLFTSTTEGSAGARVDLFLSSEFFSIVPREFLRALFLFWI